MRNNNVIFCLTAASRYFSGYRGNHQKLVPSQILVHCPQNQEKDTVLHGIIFPAKQYLFSWFFQRYRSIPSLAARPLSNGCLNFFSAPKHSPPAQSAPPTVPARSESLPASPACDPGNPEGAAHQTVCFQSYKPARPETVHRILLNCFFAVTFLKTALHNTVSALPSPPVSSETKTLSCPAPAQTSHSATARAPSARSCCYLS